jgi:hypothetical protein
MRRMILAVALILAVSVAWTTKVIAMGWLTILLAALYAIITLIHVLVHIRALRRPGPLDNRLLTLALASQVLLVGAFLVQWDAGDGLGWLTITALFGEGPGYPSSTPPLWWPHDAATVNVLAYIPVAVSWVLIARHRNKPEG